MTLAVVAGPLQGKRFVFEEHDTFVFGRHEDCHARLSPDDTTASRHHFLLEVNPPDARVRDLGSLNGTKIKEGLLFSDRAVSEIPFHLKRTEEVLQNTGDIILARNIIIREYVKESAAEIGRSANEFATMHEDRLISGVCMPKGSPLFLEIMDAIKGIAWYAKEIAVKLTPAGDISPRKPLAL